MKRASKRHALSFLAVFVAGSCSDLPMGPDKVPSIGMSDLHLALPKQVRIDIGPSTISLAPNGTSAVNVIAFSTTDFDATQVSPEDVRLIVAYQGVGAQVGTRNGSYQTSIRDFDGDGRPDRLFTFTVADLKLAGLGGCSPPLSLQGRIGEERFIGIDSTPPSFVGGAPVTSIKIVPDSVRMTISGKQQLTVKAEGPGGQSFYCGASWGSSDSTLATVDAFGLITAHGAGGPVTMSATESGLTSTAMVYVDRASQPVPATTPNTFPADLYDNPANVLENSPYFALSNAVLKDVVSVRFQEGATQAERQTAVDLVGGEVIGGQPFDNMEGYYLVRVQDDGTGAQLRAAIDVLNTLPQVGVAEPEYLHWPDEWLTHLRPQDSGNWRHWQLDPASADGENWALEAISAPMAWGCSTGSLATRIAVLDVGFRSFPDLTPNINVTQAQKYLDLYKGFRFIKNDHGTQVASVIAARGNNGEGITGVMWDAQLNLYETSLGLNGDPNVRSVAWVWKAPLPVGKMLGYRLHQAINSGSRVINISEGFPNLWMQTLPEADKFYFIKERAREYERIIRNAHNKPLIVVAAGNDPYDAFWWVIPYLAHLVPEQVIVVGGVTKVGDDYGVLSPRSAFNDNSSKFEADLVQIAAPSKDVGALGEGVFLNQTITTSNGTSSAAPLVSGTAGLLFSFDPSLTAAQVKDYLIRGARRGGRSVYGLPPAHVLNAYESLRLVAAERSGAPLCGNRMWASNGQIVAQRGTIAEPLFEVNDAVWEINALHGGRAIRIMTPSKYRSFRYAAEPDGGTWREVPDTSTVDWPVGTSGATFSYSSLSHDGDLRVRQRTTHTQNSVDIRLSLFNTQTGSETPLTTVTVPSQSAPRYSFCMTEFTGQEPRDLKPDWTDAWQEWKDRYYAVNRVFRDSTCMRHNSYATEVRFAITGLPNGAFSPTGDAFLLPINYQTHREQVVANICSQDVVLYRNPGPITERDTVTVDFICRDLRRQIENTGVDVYSVPIPGGQGWMKRPELSNPAVNIWNVRISEDGKEWSSTQISSLEDYTEGFRWKREQDRWVEFNTLHSFQEQCVTQFRDIRMGNVLTTVNACENLDDFTSTFSPSLIPGTQPEGIGASRASRRPGRQTRLGATHTSRP